MGVAQHAQPQKAWQRRARRHERRPMAAILDDTTIVCNTSSCQQKRALQTVHGKASSAVSKHSCLATTIVLFGFLGVHQLKLEPSLNTARMRHSRSKAKASGSKKEPSKRSTGRRAAMPATCAIATATGPCMESKCHTNHVASAHPLVT